ncbi:hypothetical protein K7W42_04555 [Deinococcus sp. HMF7604]|uniref:Ig-like domain-containing protein n=1 Tax=Deinococcus betulae TaxID=2873312 RepID=UPI001CC982DC|nr:Ig-like domain-containing protein [Deinococcus betulae]MBZ9750131.1 hypothetical protein [Deinococcus betulae]
MRPFLPTFAALTLALSACGTVVNTPPTLSLTAPAATVQRTQVTLTGQASDSDGSLQSVTAQVNGKSHAATLNGTAYTVTVPLKAGTNTITLTATDNQGETAAAQAEIALGRSVAAAGSHSGALKGGALYTWGRNNFGQTGLGKTTTLAASADHPVSPTAITAPAPFVALAFNQNQSLAIAEGGALYSWGDDTNGQLGRGTQGRANCGAGTNNCRLDIGKVAGLPAAAQVSAGYSHTLVLAEDGGVWAFGLNSSG